MKRKHCIAFYLAVCLGLLAVLPAFGDERDIEYKAYVIAAFGGTNQDEWVVEGSSYSSTAYTWNLDASKYAHKEGDVTYPQKKEDIDAWPMALFGANPEGDTKPKSFGIWGKFDRRGHNWIDVYPSKEGEKDPSGKAKPTEIPFPGRISSMNMWVWGSNLNFRIEAYVRDYEDMIHVIDFGSIAFTGWKNLRVKVPATIRQSKRIQPNLANLKFVKFRIWTDPWEKVDNFYIYFNQFKVLTDTFETLYDGNELAHPEHVRELWGVEEKEGN